MAGTRLTSLRTGHSEMLVRLRVSTLSLDCVRKTISLINRPAWPLFPLQISPLLLNVRGCGCSLYLGAGTCLACSIRSAIRLVVVKFVQLNSYSTHLNSTRRNFGFKLLIRKKRVQTLDSIWLCQRQDRQADRQTDRQICRQAGVINPGAIPSINRD